MPYAFLLQAPDKTDPADFPDGYTTICAIVKDQASILPCQHSLEFMMPDLSAALPFPVAQVPEKNDPAGFPDGYMAICAIVNAPQFRILTGLCGALICVVVLLQVPDKDDPAEFPDGYMAICAIVKNQARDIREWLEYHRWLGVGKVYVYDNNSTVRGRQQRADCSNVSQSLSSSLLHSLPHSLLLSRLHSTSNSKRPSSTRRAALPAAVVAATFPPAAAG